jgi:hypothetical protein
MESLENLNGLIFELSEKIPEGAYLNLMNYSKKIYDAMKKNEIIMYNRNPDTHLLKYIYFFDDIGDTDKISFMSIEEEDYFLRVNDCIRLICNGTNKKYIKIVKINKHSIIYNLYFCLSYSFYIKENIKLVFSKGEYNNNFLDHKIYFYPNETANNEFKLIFENKQFEKSNNLNIYNEFI